MSYVIEPPDGGFYVGAPGYADERSTNDGTPVSPGVPLNYSLKRGAPNTMLDQPAFAQIAPPMPGRHRLPEPQSLEALFFTQPSGGLPTFVPWAIRAASTVHSGPSANLNGCRYLLTPPLKFSEAQRNPIRPRNVGDRGSFTGSRAPAPALSLGGG